MTPLPTWMTSGVGRPSQTGAHSHTPADWVRPHPWSGSYWSQCWSVTPGHSPPPAGRGRPPPSPTTPVGTCPLSVGRAQNIGYYIDTGNMQSPILYTNTVHREIYALVIFSPLLPSFLSRGISKSYIISLFKQNFFWVNSRQSETFHKQRQTEITRGEITLYSVPYHSIHFTCTVCIDLLVENGGQIYSD